MELGKGHVRGGTSKKAKPSHEAYTIAVRTSAELQSRHCTAYTLRRRDVRVEEMQTGWSPVQD